MKKFTLLSEWSPDALTQPKGRGDTTIKIKDMMGRLFKKSVRTKEGHKQNIDKKPITEKKLTKSVRDNEHHKGKKLLPKMRIWTILEANIKYGDAKWGKHNIKEVDDSEIIFKNKEGYVLSNGEGDEFFLTKEELKNKFRTKNKSDEFEEGVKLIPRFKFIVIDSKEMIGTDARKKFKAEGRDVYIRDIASDELGYVVHDEGDDSDKTLRFIFSSEIRENYECILDLIKMREDYVKMIANQERLKEEGAW